MDKAVVIDEKLIQKQWKRLNQRQHHLDLDKADLRTKEIAFYQQQEFECKSCVIKPTLGNVILMSDYYHTNEAYAEGWRFSEYGLICPKCGIMHRPLSQESKEKYHLNDNNLRHTIFTNAFSWFHNSGKITRINGTSVLQNWNPYFKLYFNIEELAKEFNIASKKISFAFYNI